MADLLARLAERTLRTVPTAQPVLTSRFDPGQVMTPPVLETEAWNTAGPAPVQDAATTRRPEPGGIPLTQGRQEGDMATPDAATPDPPKIASRAGGQEVANHLDTNRAGTMQTEIATAAPGDASTGLVETGSMQSSQMDINQAETGSELSGQPDTNVIELIQMETDVSAPRTTTTNPGVTKSGIGPTFAPESAELPAPLHENPPFVGNPYTQEAELSLPSPEVHQSHTELSLPSPEAHQLEVELSLPSPEVHQSHTELSLPLPAAHKPEVESPLPAPELEVMNALPGEQVAMHRALAPGLPLQHGESAVLEQEEYISSQPVVQRNSIAPPVEYGQVSAPFEQAISLQPEETLSPGASRGAREEYKVELSLESNGGANRVPARGTLPGLKPGHKLAPVGAGATPTVDGLKGLLSHPQSPSSLHTGAQKEALLLEEAVEEAQLSRSGNTAAGEHATGPNAKPEYNAHKKEEIVTVEQHLLASQEQAGYNASAAGRDQQLMVEQHLLLPQAQLQQGIVPQELADESNKSALTAGPVRNHPRSALVQHGPADSQPGSAASAAARPPTPPSIHITIGRIDVRAVTPLGPTRPSKPARPSPLLSLDDYLKQDKGGRQ